MALITDETGAEVWGFLNQTPNQFGFEDASQAKRHINQFILPDLNAQMQIKADGSAAPLDFPLTDAQVAEARPDWDATARQEHIDRVASSWRLSVIYRAAATLMMTAGLRGSNADERRQSADVFLKMATDAETSAMSATKEIVSLTTSGRSYDPTSGVTTPIRRDGYSDASCGYDRNNRYRRVAGCRATEYC